MASDFPCVYEEGVGQAPLAAHTHEAYCLSRRSSCTLHSIMARPVGAGLPRISDVAGDEVSVPVQELPPFANPVIDEVPLVKLPYCVQKHRNIRSSSEALVGIEESDQRLAVRHHSLSAT